MKKRFALHVAIVAFFGIVNFAQAGQVSLADWCVNVNGDTASACNGGGSGSASISLGSFDTTLEPGSNTLGSITVNLSQGNGQFVGFYTDYDVSFTKYGSFTDSATTVGSAPAGMSYEIDDPSSNIFNDFAAGTLSNTNNLGAASGAPNPCCDVAAALGVMLDVPAGGQTVTFVVSSTAPGSGFYIQQTNSQTNDSIYLQAIIGAVPVNPNGAPEPSTFALGFVALGSLLFFKRRRSA